MKKACITIVSKVVNQNDVLSALRDIPQGDMEITPYPNGIAVYPVGPIKNYNTILTELKIKENILKKDGGASISFLWHNVD